MGLKKLVQQDLSFYMHFKVSRDSQGKEELLVTVLEKDGASTVKLTTDNDDLQRWCTKLDRSQQEYMSLLCEAVSSEDNNEGVFEVSENHLIWKQYFPDKDVYGKKGKFKMEKVEYQVGLTGVLDGALKDLQENAQHVHKLTKEAEDNAKQLDDALEVASKSVQMKEEFEKEIYSKCAAIINAKKLRIHQLRSTHPSSSGQTSSLARTSEDQEASARPAKKARQEASDSGGYSSDTDVDEPGEEEMDTDEEKLVSISPTKQRGKDREAHSKAKTASDSQTLFNDSLEAELYPTGVTTTVMPRRPGNPVTATKSHTQPPQLTRGKGDQAPQLVELDSPRKESVSDDETQSILNEFF